MLEVIENTGQIVWLGGRESLGRFQETPMNTGLFSATSLIEISWRFPIVSSAFVRLRLFADFADVMSLKMSLAESRSIGVRYIVREPHER